MTTTSQTRSFELRKRHGAYVLDASGSALKARGSLRRGEITTATGTFLVSAIDRRHAGAVVTLAGREVFRLHPEASVLPGGRPARWTGNHHTGTLAAPGGRITVQAARRPRGPVRVEVSGEWADFDLVVLTACFAVLSRRRRRNLQIAAIAAATSH